MKIAAVCGPYSAPDSWMREENIRCAEMVATAIMAAPTWGAVCVHSISRFWHGHADRHAALLMWATWPMIGAQEAAE